MYQFQLYDRIFSFSYIFYVFLMKLCSKFVRVFVTILYSIKVFALFEFLNCYGNLVKDQFSERDTFFYQQFLHPPALSVLLSRMMRKRILGKKFNFSFLFFEAQNVSDFLQNPNLGAKHIYVN